MSLRSIFRSVLHGVAPHPAEPAKASGLDSVNFEFMLTSLMTGTDLRRLSAGRDTGTTRTPPQSTH